MLIDSIKKEVLLKSWVMLKENENYWSLFAVMFGLLILLAVPVVGILLSGVLYVGLNIVLYRAYRENKLELAMIFDPFTKERYINSLVGFILKSVFTFFWALLFIIPGIVKSYSYAMTGFLLADNEKITGKEALEASKKIMEGNKKRLFFLDLSFIGWFLLSILTLGIGFIFLMPYVYSARVAFYIDLVKESETVNNEMPKDSVESIILEEKEEETEV